MYNLCNKYTGSELYSQIEISNATIINNKGDGYCIFRSLSIILTGSEQNYMYIKNIVRDERKKNGDQIALQ